MVCNPPQNYRSASFFWRSIDLVVLSLAVVTVGLLGPAAKAQNIFNCPGFSSSGSCGLSSVSGGTTDFRSNADALVGTSINLAPAGSGHSGYDVWYQTPVNVQAFTTTFTFVPGCCNVAFVVQNVTSEPPANAYSGGAGAEAGFSQFAGGTNIVPNNIFALEFDSYSSLTNNPGTWSYSSAQIYQPLQAPFMPTGGCSLGGGCGVPNYPINKISTSPVPLATSQGQTTGDTYSATVTYNGDTLTLSLYDITAGGSCPGSRCFTQTWSGVYIPAIVGGTKAYVGFTNGSAGVTPTNLLISSFSYTVNTPATLSGTTAWNANSTYNDGTLSAASPVYSIAPGSYSGTQSVSISTSTSGAYICYSLASSPPALTPQPDNNGGCNAGTLYTGPITVSSTATLYAMAGTSSAADPSTLGPPSTLVAGTYTIGSGGSASTPTFSPGGGTYSGTQSVTLSTTSSGGVICYNTTGSPATNGSTGCATGTLYTGPVTVSSGETLYAVAGGTGYGDSAVGSASYVIQAAVATPTFSPGGGSSPPPPGPIPPRSR